MEKRLINLELVEEGSLLHESEHVIAAEGAVDIVCSASGAQHSESGGLLFLRGGQAVPGAEEDAAASRLRIPAFQPSHSGRYECSVRRPDGSFQRRFAQLRINLPSTLPFSSSPSTSRLTNGKPHLES